ncbi:MAG TPA: thiamine-phosphate kinase [Pirellulales bacterium]|nr:thiamine-phosphate kinase [Pirellulales bacterium]
MESDFIRWLRHRLPNNPQLAVGPGDDAAVLRWGQKADCVLTVDLLTDGVDFELDQVDPARVGRKALAVNLSDLAAMAARPLAAVIALALPRRGGLRLAQALYEGLIPLAQRYQLAIAGGDTNSWEGPLVISVTLVGEVTQGGPLCRGGAQSGDRIVVTGQFGGSILGHHFDFEPRVDESLALAGQYPLHAGIDVSDGLALDLSRLAEESGCGAAVDLSKIPIAPAAGQLAAGRNDGSTPLDHALADGEDFELILAVPPEAADEMIAKQPLDCGLTVIGQFVGEPGLWQVDAAGVRRPLAPRGFEHRLDP